MEENGTRSEWFIGESYDTAEKLEKLKEHLACLPHMNIVGPRVGTNYFAEFWGIVFSAANPAIKLRVDTWFTKRADFAAFVESINQPLPREWLNLRIGFDEEDLGGRAAETLVRVLESLTQWPELKSLKIDVNTLPIGYTRFPNRTEDEEPQFPTEQATPKYKNLKNLTIDCSSRNMPVAFFTEFYLKNPTLADVQFNGAEVPRPPKTTKAAKRK